MTAYHNLFNAPCYGGQSAGGKDEKEVNEN